MRKTNNEQKDKINILLNIDNFYGKHSGNIGRILIFIVSIAVPFMIYALLFAIIIPIQYFMIIYIPYSIKMALVIIGKEKEKMESFMKRKNDEYASTKDLIMFSDIHEDGCVEYQNGLICYIISAYGYSYMDDNKYSKDLEIFLTKLFNKYPVDIYGHLVIEELGVTQDDLESLRVYKDQEFLEERLNFYKYQEKLTNETSMLYRMNFVVKGYKRQWNNLSKDVRNIVASEVSQVFESCKVCNREEVIDVMSRDATIFIDIGEMLRTKYNSEKYYGSKILYYNDEIPDSMKEKVVDFEEEEGRREFYDKKG